MKIKKFSKILASVIAGVMLATPLASCDLSSLKDLLPSANQEQNPSNAEKPSDEKPNGEEREPVVLLLHDFEGANPMKNWVFYNAAHTGEKDVCGEIVVGENENHLLKIIGEGDKWEGIQYDPSRGLGMRSKEIRLTVLSDKEIKDLKFALEYELNQFIYATADISVGKNEISLCFEQEFSLIFSFSVKTKHKLYDAIYLDNISVVENK